MPVVADYTALLSGQSWTGGPSGQAVTLTYSFSTTAGAELRASNPAAAASFVPFTEAEKATTRAALGQWAAVSGITFHETTRTQGTITFGLYDLGALGESQDAGLAYYPGTGLYLDGSGRPQIYSNFRALDGDVLIDRAYAANPAYAADFAHVVLHEIGHALGLKHPFEGPGNTLDPSLDDGAHTVMAYNGLRSATLEPLDIAAIQALYGTKSGAVVPFRTVWRPATESLTEYGTAAAQLMFGSGGDDVFFAGGGRDAISGGEGDDTVYADGAPISVNGGPGLDTVVTGLTYGPSTVIGGSNGFRYIYLPAFADFQSYASVERLDFTNGVYDTTVNSFTAVQPGTYAYTGAVDTTWATPGNWKALVGGTAARAPGAADAVTIGYDGTLAGGGQSANLVLTARTTLAGSYRTGALTAAGTTTLGSGTTLAVTGAATLAGGLITVAGASAVLEIGGSGYATGGSGTVELDAGGLITGYGTINASAFDNYGTIVATGGTLRLIGAQRVQTPGPSQVAAGSTLWVQNLHGAYTLTGPGATLRTDTPDYPLGAVPTIAGFVPGTALVLAGTLATATYTRTGPGVGVLDADETRLVLLGDYGDSAFAAVADVAENTVTVTVGPRPNPLFDAAFYLARNPDIRAAGADPAAHYKTFGWREGRDPAALFSTAIYLATNPDVHAAGIDPLDHYERFGWREGRNPDAWFDSHYYLVQNPDVAAAGVNPLLHFTTGGWREGREPGLLFSDAKYLAANPDVRAAGVNPLAHYATSGRAEGRAALLLGGTAPADPLVDTVFYDRQLGATLIPPGLPGAMQAAASYDATGWRQGLAPDPWFDTRYYLARNPDVAAAHINPLAHYEANGWHEGRNPSAAFSTAKYLAAYADIRAAGIDPLLHYVTYGNAEGRTAFSV